MSIYQKFARDIGVIGSTNLLISLRGLILLPILTKMLGADDYGIWVQVMVTIGLAEALITFGLPFAMVRFLPAEKEREVIQERFYSTLIIILLVSVVVALLFFLFSDIIARNLFDGATDIAKLISLIILIHCLNRAYLAFFRAFRQILRYSIFMLLQSFGEIGLIVYFVSVGHGIFSAVLSILIVRAILFLFLSFLITRRIGVKIPNFSRVGEHLHFGLPLMPAILSSWVVGASDRYIISYFLGVTSVGIYSSGYVLGAIIAIAIAPLSFVLPPALSKLYDEGRIEEVKTHLTYSLKYFLMLAIPFVFGAALLSKQILSILSTSEIAAQGYLIAPIVAMATLIFGVGGVIAQVLVVVKKTKITGAAWIIAAGVNLLLNILLVPRIGIMGAAIATLIAYTLASGIMIYFSFKYLKFSIDWKSILKSLAASGVMSLVIWSIYPIQSLNVFIVVVIGILVYVTALFLLRDLTYKELKFFKSLFRRA